MCAGGFDGGTSYCADTRNDPANCGSCGAACPASQLCVSGHCVVGCTPGLTMCAGRMDGGVAAYCAGLQDDPSNCGGCGVQCSAPAHEVARCTAGHCSYVCAPGFGDCNGTTTDGCETDLGSTVGDCGACGVVCAPAHATGACVAGACTIGSCATGFGDCNHAVADGCETALGVPCTPAAPCRTGATACGPTAAVCNDTGPQPAGSMCGSGMFCSATSACVMCSPGAPCSTGTPCTTGTTDCTTGTPVCHATRLSANAPCGTNQICNASGACVASVITTSASCGNPAGGGSISADALCMQQGFTGASEAHGYWWGQCAGTGDRCPGGWQGDGTLCPNWCPGTDCVGAGFCTMPFGWTVHERVGNGSTTFSAIEFGGTPCSSFNPGWTVRVRCYF